MNDGRLIQVATPRELVAEPADEFVRSLIESPKRRARALADAMGTAVR
jgi:ABC-type proline/glycine betaine transport system ATPase subunit